LTFQVNENQTAHMGLVSAIILELLFNVHGSTVCIELTLSISSIAYHQLNPDVKMAVFVGIFPYFCDMNKTSDERRYENVNITT